MYRIVGHLGRANCQGGLPDLISSIFYLYVTLRVFLFFFLFSKGKKVEEKFILLLIFTETEVNMRLSKLFQEALCITSVALASLGENISWPLTMYNAKTSYVTNIKFGVNHVQGPNNTYEVFLPIDNNCLYLETCSNCAAEN